jgi:dGTPase
MSGSENKSSASSSAVPVSLPIALPIKIAEMEAERLAPYATRSLDTRGRAHAEVEHPFRSAFQRDRDRVIHCNAFRRLEYKTQVFVYHEGDHYRTRLTHTIEVAQITRTIARALALNEDLSEAIALAHDLGHPPFGHTGEDILNDLMGGYGGFEHNGHTLRIVEELEHRYPEFRGLNLTWEVREGIAKHGTDYDKPKDNDVYDMEKGASLEARIADMADEIAYNNHDLDDGLSSNMIDTAQLKEVSIWQEIFEDVVSKNPGADFKVHKYQAVKRIINLQVTDLIDNILVNLKDNGIKCVDDVRAAGSELASFSPEMALKNRELKDFLNENLYNHNRVLRMANKARRILGSLFELYADDPRLLPPHYLSEIERIGEKRLICDYIAGMTDRFAMDEYQKLFDPYEKV